MNMAWGIVVGLVVCGFIGLCSQVFTFDMWNLWLSMLVGAVLGGFAGWAYGKVGSWLEARKKRAEQAA